jgi:hypothetical protein
VAVNVDLNDDVQSAAGVELEAKPIDLSGKIVPKIMITSSNKDVHYLEESVMTPFMVRVRVKLKATVAPGL